MEKILLDKIKEATIGGTAKLLITYILPSVLASWIRIAVWTWGRGGGQVIPTFS